MADTRGFEVLTHAHAYLAEVVASVGQSAWGTPTPCSEWTVRQVLNHARVDQQAYGLAITGGRPDSDPFHPADALDGDPAAELDKVLRQVADAYAGLPADSDQVPTPLGPLPPWIAAGAAAMDAAVHAWDIAMASGQPSPLTPELSLELLTVARQIVEPLRQYGVYAAELEPQPGDDAEAKLLRYLGRDPHWTAGAAGAAE